MEAAGALCAERIARRTSGPITVLCGPGHNGADGLVIARHLHARGYDVAVHVTPGRNSDLYREQLARLPVSPGPLRLEGTLVDALFGLGFAGPLRDDARRLIERVNAAPVRRIAIDVPSGLDADRGLGPAIRADVTLTLGLAKPGFFINEGPAYVGRLSRVNIGLPRALTKQIASTHGLYVGAAKDLPPRPPSANKTHFGHAALIAGRAGSWGAGALAADAAFRAGAGYVTWASFDQPLDILSHVPEVMTANLGDDAWLDRATAVGVGPGLGVGDATARLIERLKSKDVPVLLDADALTTCARFQLWPLPKHWVITPHAGELARLLDRDAGEIERDRFQAVVDANAKLGCVTLLKGYRTLVGDGRRVRVINAGGPALAKAGAGDVLTGLITGFMAQGLDSFRAACLGAFVHGRVADDFVAEGGHPAALRASDLARLLPRTLGGLP